MMYAASLTRTRSAVSTCTAARVDAVLDLVLGDLVGLIARGLVSRERAADWLRDLTDVLLLQAVERFQVKISLPGGSTIGVDYEVFDDGRLRATAACGGFASHWIPWNAQVSLVVGWRHDSLNYPAARRLLQGRGWGAATLLEASGEPERVFAKDGYGFSRRMLGDWQA